MTETSFAGAPAAADMAAGTDEVAGAAFGNSEVVEPAVTSAAGSFDNGERRAPAVQGGNSNDRLDLLGNVEMDVTAELGRTRMTVRELLSLAPGTVVELDRAATAP
jgi:flagellar motor switch protein FliN/FliY